MCTKNRYASVQAARRACRQVGSRLRVYFCRDCRAYHVTNDEKRGR